jgi:predicted AlkP superfamily pyrophosphatase or phosphodiesterase
MRGCERLPGKPLILAVVDGLTPSMFEHAAEKHETFRLLAEHGRYVRASSVFPSLTPVCVSSIVTGAYPDVHGIPHLVWYNRAEQRLVEYGSSFGAIRAAGTRRSILDAIFNMNEHHLSPEAVTLFEAVADAGLVPAAVNIPCYRGRTTHRTTLPGVGRTARGPERFFFFSLFESDPTGAPLAVRDRKGGTVDEYATAVGRWLVTRDGFDLFVYYLSDFDYLSHASGPDAAHEGLARADSALGALVEAAGGPDAFLDRYAFMLCSDHGQTPVHRAARLQARFDGVEGVVVTASNRAGMVYRLDACRLDARGLAATLDTDPAVDASMFLDGGEPVLRREGEEERVVDRRLEAALRNPNAGDVLVSAALGYEFADLGGRHHAGGGSHGSLARGDSEVPVLLVGVEGEPLSITDLAPLALAHLGLEAPPYARPLAGVH